MSIAVTFASTVTVVETVATQYISSSDNTITTNGLNESQSLTGATGVPVTKHSAYRLTLSSGTGTIDLTSLPGNNSDETVTFSGLKVQIAKFRNLSSNANDITVAKGASNGWTGFGSSATFTLSPGQSVTFYLNEAAPDVSGSVKTLDVTGSGSQVLEVQLVAG